MTYPMKFCPKCEFVLRPLKLAASELNKETGTTEGARHLVCKGCGYKVKYHPTKVNPNSRLIRNKIKSARRSYGKVYEKDKYKNYS